MKSAKKHFIKTQYLDEEQGKKIPRTGAYLAYVTARCL